MHVRLSEAGRMNGARTIVADPPWAYDDKISSGKPIRGAGNHYGLMTMGELVDLPVWRLAGPKCALYLWTTNAFIGDAWQLARAWGFTPKTVITWIKPGLGMGRTFRGTTEHMIFASRGGEGLRRKDLPTHFYAPKGRHSAKPDESYRLIERASRGPFLELFARRRRPGWASWGNEVPQ